MNPEMMWETKRWTGFTPDTIIRFQSPLDRSAIIAADVAAEARK